MPFSSTLQSVDRSDEDNNDDYFDDGFANRSAVVHAQPSLPHQLLIRPRSMADELRCLRDHQASHIDNGDELIPLVEDTSDGLSTPRGAIARRDFMDDLLKKLMLIRGFMSLHSRDPRCQHFDAFLEDEMGEDGNSHRWQITFVLDGADNLVKSYYLRDDMSQHRSEVPVFQVILKTDNARNGNQVIFVPHEHDTITTLLDRSSLVEPRSPLKSSSDTGKGKKIFDDVRVAAGKVLHAILTLGAPPEEEKHGLDLRTHRDDLRFQQAALRGE